MRFTLSPLQVCEIVRLYRLDCTAESLAEFYRCTTQQIDEILRQNGVVIRSKDVPSWQKPRERRPDQ